MPLKNISGQSYKVNIRTLDHPSYCSHATKYGGVTNISLQMPVFKYHYVTISHTTTSKTHTQLEIRFLRCSTQCRLYILMPLAQSGRSLHGRWMRLIFQKLTSAICTTQVKIIHTLQPLRHLMITHAKKCLCVLRNIYTNV